MGMKAAIKKSKTDAQPCVVFWTGRKNFHVEVLTYCQKRLDASDEGVIQIPDIADHCPECDVKLQAVYEAELAKRASGG